MKLSIVTSVYLSESSILEFHKNASQAARLIAGESYEIIFVNDCSPDSSLEVLLRLHENDPHVVVVDLSRNFGQHRAIMTGLTESRGQLIYLLDSDLEEDPNWLLNFHMSMLSTNGDVVYGVQKKRKGKLLEKITGALFYRIFSSVTGVPLSPSLVTARLMTRRYVDALLLHTERELFLAGLWHITGFLQVPQTVSKRHLDNTSYPLRKKLRLALTSVVSFSSRPLIWVFALGLGIMLLAIIYGSYVLVTSLTMGAGGQGWPSLILSLWFLGGANILATGIVGVYLSKVYEEVKKRPYTIRRETYRHG